MNARRPGFAPPPGITLAQVHRAGLEGTRPETDMLARECAVALEFNGVSHAVMLATPMDLEDFALGFALSEGIIDQSAECYGIDVDESAQGWTVHVEISAGCFARLKQLRRNLAGRTGCGLCGVESLAQVERSLPHAKVPGEPIKGGSVRRALTALAQHQIIGGATGATHAAAWADRDGNIRIVREDVGRHNALDKLIGAGARARSSDWGDGMIVVTSRASMEMVQKAAIAGFGVLVALSAPTDLAVRLAQQCGMCLAGFATPDRWTLYSQPERIAPLTAGSAA